MNLKTILGKAKNDLLSQDTVTLCLRLTAIFLLIYGFTGVSSRLSNTLIRVLCVGMLISKSFLLKKETWFALFGITTWFLIQTWSILDNNHFLIVYWLLTCALACMSKNPGEVLAWNGRLLVGLAFGFAVCWKVFNMEYFNGSFFDFILITDPRFKLVNLMAGIPADRVIHNATLSRELRLFGGPYAFGEFYRNAGIAFFALFLSYWTLAVEGAIALTFLFKKSKLLSHLRNIPLLVFIGTTYALAPVPRFANVLLIMGYAQCSKEKEKTRLLYLLLFIFMHLIILIPRLDKLLLK